jgi:hypothetical protein
MFSAKSGKMDKVDPMASNEPEFSTNMTDSSLKKKEKLVAWVLATKFHTKPAEEPEADKEVRLNPIMKDLIINGYVDENHTRCQEEKEQETEDRG